MPDLPRLPALAEPAPFTVAVAISGDSLGIPVESSSAAAEVTRFFLDREPSSSPGWGPSWDKTTRAEYIELFVHDRGTVHFVLVRAGRFVPDSLLTRCGERVTTLSADFSHRGLPCTTCLAHWRNRCVGMRRAAADTSRTTIRWS